MRLLLLVALLALNLTSIQYGHCEELAPQALKQLLRKADDWSVPQPDGHSRLVKIWAHGRSSGGVYAIGFIEPARPDRVLVGFTEWDMNGKKPLEVPKPEDLRLEDVTVESPFSDPHGYNFGLVTAVQLLRMGHEKPGLALMNQAFHSSSGHHSSPFLAPADEPATLMLARCCVAAAMNEITSAKPDFLSIKRRIDRLVADEPALRNKAIDSAIESLKANIGHQLPPEGTMERIVDDYLLCGGSWGMKEPPPAERRLILKGFDAIPTLLKNRHSQRFSNHLYRGEMNGASYAKTVAEVVDNYIWQFCNGTLPFERRNGLLYSDAVVKEWWDKSQSLGEQAYVAKYMICENTHGFESLSTPLLIIASDRYPQLLTGAYRALLKTSVPSWKVGDAIVRSKAIPLEEKRQLLNAGIATKHVAHRNTALDDLRQLDAAISNEILLGFLKAAPNTTKGTYWDDPDANLGRFVASSRDPKVWQAFHKLLDRADLGMQMELIDHLRPPRDAPAEILDSYHQVYLRYSADERIRDETSSQKFSGPGAAMYYKQISMRDFIHLHWASWLKLKLDRPEFGSSNSDWQNFRSRVNLALTEDRQSQK